MQNSMLFDQFVHLRTKASLRVAVLALGSITASCATLNPNAGTCMSASGLSAPEIQALTAQENPVLSVDSTIVMCSCYDLQKQKQKNSEDGADVNANRGTMVGSGESGQLLGNGERGTLDGSGETGTLTGSSETGTLVGQNESGQLVGGDESGQLVGDEEFGAMVGASESGAMVGAGEGGELVGAGERGLLNGQWSRDTALTCAVDKECSGYRLVGLSQETVNIVSAEGARSASAACITW